MWSKILLSNIVSLKTFVKMFLVFLLNRYEVSSKLNSQLIYWIENLKWSKWTDWIFKKNMFSNFFFSKVHHSVAQTVYLLIRDLIINIKWSRFTGGILNETVRDLHLPQYCFFSYFVLMQFQYGCCCIMYRKLDKNINTFFWNSVNQNI